MSTLGQICVVGALALAVYAVAASLVGVRLRLAELVASGRNAAFGVAVLLTAAAATLIVALVAHDFSLRYVWDHSNRAMPLDLVVPAFYSGQEGSLLYWATTLGLFSAIVLWQQRRGPHADNAQALVGMGARPGPQQALMPYVVAVLMTIEAFMTLLLGFVSTPFERLPFVPPDGVGLNPLLYDEGMRIHPPMLLAGLMSWSVPFAFAIAALATGRLGNEWIALTRRYALVAWLILGLGNLLGAWWAYHVLGWGGYWGWDPVENVALMPWLVGTAFVHSIQIQERRGMLKAWNVLLVLVTFYLSIFGTFVVRSGILASVHSFALSAIGPYFLTFLGLAIAGSLGLFFWRLPRLRSDNELDSLLSRESSFLLNNLLFLGVAFAVFWGTIYPLVAEAFGGAKITVGPPYFQQVAGPLLGGTILLMGIAPLLPWRRASRENLARNFTWPVAGTLVALLALFVVGVRNPYALVGFGLCGFVLATILQEFGRGAAARHQATGEAYPLALVHLVRRNNRRYGGYIVHLGIILIGAGVVGSHVYQQAAQGALNPGESLDLGGYTITARGLNSFDVPGARVIEAPLQVNGGDLRPQKVYFQNFPDQPSTKVGLRSSPLEDLYVVLAGWDGDGPTARVSLSVFVNPMVGWIWVGGVVLLFGACVALWSAPQPSVRRVLARVPEGAVGVAG
jgi:cytochrome c-type biogenesis protein CcmF